MRLSTATLVAAAAWTSSVTAAPTTNDAWQPLRDGIDAWAALDFDAHFAVNVGTNDGRQFLYTKDLSMTDKLEGASLSKWPAAIMISGLVNDGIMSYDDKANKYLDFWATDPLDSRSEVTLESLLSFTSGYEGDEYIRCDTDYLTCAEKMYHRQLRHTKPRTKFAYLSCHLQYAGAMAVAASGKNIQDLFKEYLYEPFNMVGTSWSQGSPVPSMAGGIETTGADFENLMQGLLTYKVLPKTILDEVETDWTKDPVSPSGDGWFGHYGFGHWWECMGYGTPSERANLSQTCLDAHIQAGPGEFGFYPLLDRSGGGGAAGVERPAHWFQVILQEPDALSGIPEYLRIVAKPVSDYILNGTDPTTIASADLQKAGGGILRRDIDYIQTELKTCTCSEKPTADGEPFASLVANLPQDDPSLNRQDILDNGGGLSLFDVVEIQKTLGTCNCTGRRDAQKTQTKL